jgi:ADP-dependent NAD(P)H-hydrate dehydratase / NAD(P)H-hydrate epimerase
MKYVVTAAEMRALDAATIRDLGLPGAVLMENAGHAVAREVLALLGDRAAAATIAVVCGAGNNGGDGYVAARWLRAAGVAAAVYLAADEARIAGDARLHLEVYRQCGGVLFSIADAAGLSEHRRDLEGAAVVLDCLLGTGLERAVEGHLAEVIEVVNRGTGVRVAVDIPSGLSADSGQPLGACIEAHRTVTMAFLKVGITVAPGFARAGEVTVADIGIPRPLAQAQGVRLALVEPVDVAPLVPVAAPLEHKNSRGHCLVVAGSPGKRGAARLTAWAALRAGAGLVTLATDDLGQPLPDPLMAAALVPGPEAPVRLAELARGKRALALGPGLATGPDGRALVLAALELELPLVIDADGLNHLASDASTGTGQASGLARVAAAAPPVVLTPHPGEAARLLGIDTAEVERDRVAAARELAARSGAVVVLKGARTLICDGIAGDGFVTINPTGNPALATAGSGDVLTGVIAGLCAQGLGPAEAARLGVWIHGAAADLLAPELGRGTTAADLADAIPRALSPRSP